MHSFFSSLIQVLTHYKLIPPFLKQLFPKSLYQRKDKLTPMQYILVEQRTKKPFFSNLPRLQRQQRQQDFVCLLLETNPAC